MTVADDATLERDLLSHLLDLVEVDDPASFAAEALELVMRLLGVERGYLALSAPPDSPLERPAWTATRGFEPGEERDPEAVRRVLSTTVIAEALASGETVATGSARRDPRYAASDSVHRNAIEAVLCVPIQATAARDEGRGGPPPFGLLYLQGLVGDDTAKRFPAERRRLAERFARHLAPVASRIVRAAKAASPAPDPTAPWRARLLGSDPLVGRSPALAEVLKAASLVAPLDVPVLITGPTGTGKTALARLIARASRRAGGPFVELNSATLPETLLESELFGALPGAHSTATRRMLGKVEAADGGTLFLDEIGDLSLGSQAKLLQLLADGTYFPLGATTPKKADVRVIAATHVDLEARIAAGRFREDLWYRLRVMPIAMPGLDERRRDIPALAESFLAAACERHGFEPLGLGADTAALITRADWPGNIRELQHALEAAAIRASGEGARVVAPEHVFPPAPGAPAPIEGGWHGAMRELQRRMLADALEQSGGSVREAAKRLGLARSHAYELVKQLGLKGG